jgi:hypothetical protein
MALCLLTLYLMTLSKNYMMPNDIITNKIQLNIIMVNYIMAKNKMLCDITERSYFIELHNADCHHANINYAEQGILKGGVSLYH